MSTTPDTSEPQLTAVRQLLDDALFGLRGIEDPNVAVREAHRCVSSALTHLYEAVRSKGNFADAHRHLSRAMEDTRSALEALQDRESDDPALAVDIARVARALGRIGGVGLSFDTDGVVPAPDTTVTPATLGEPALRRIMRDAIPPSVPLGERDPRPLVASAVEPPGEIRTLEQLDALLARAQSAAAELDAAEEAAEAAELGTGDDDLEARDTIPPEPAAASEPELDALVFGRAIDERRWIRERAAYLLEDLAAMGRMRFPSDILPWLHADETERRLLTRIDALTACGAGVVPHLVRMLEERPVPDPDLLWALIMWLGSLDGTDSMDQIDRLVRIADLGDPESAEMIGNALGLAPHPGIEPYCRAWLASPLPERRALGVRVLSERRALSLQEAVEASQDVELAVVRQAAEAFGRFPELVPGHVFNRLLHHEDLGVLRAALASAMRHRRPAALRRAIELCEAGRAGDAEAAMFVAIGAEEDDGRRALMEGAAASGGATVLRAIGWFGDPGMIEYLIGRLRGDDPVAAGFALERITGALLPPDGKLPEHAPDDRPFARPWSDPIVLPEPCVDPSAWTAWWKEHRRAVRPGTRYRWGHAFSPRDDLWEMAEPSTPIGERFWAWLELSVRTGGNLPLDAHRFAVHQQRSLDQWRGWVSRLGERAGEGRWSVRYSA